MKGLRNWLVVGALFLVLFPVRAGIAQSVQVTPDMMKKAQEALAQGLITPEQARELQQKAAAGTLTQAEIEAGKKLMEERQGKSVESPSLPLQKPAQLSSPVVVETAPGSLIQKEEARGSVTQHPVGRLAPRKGAEAHFEEQYFKKTDDPEYPVLPLFGHELFTSAPSTFAPIKDIPVSNDYLIGPDDELKVLTWGLIEATYSLTVDREGMINLPKIGRMPVGGLTFGEAKELIRSKVEAMTGVQSAVSMGSLRSIHVMVLGEVKAPGLYTISALATVANALLTSGGPTPLGSLRKVQLKRQGKTIATMDLYDFLLKGDTSSDGRLVSGDVIFVPQVGPLVMVSGNVKRPAAYEMKDSTTLETALNLAGGFAPRAFNQRIQIERSQANKAQVVVDITQAELAQKKGIPVVDGDLIRVFSILPDAQNAVFLYGNVRRPGRYAFHNGLKLSDLLPNVESLDIDSHFDYALIKRYRLNDMKAELIPFDLGALILKQDQRQDINLVPLDEVYVFKKNLFRDADCADIEGQVRRPGRFHIQDMKVRDLILKAGDLTAEAYLKKAEVIRIDAQRNRHTLYFDVAAALRDDPEHNLVLQNEDRLIIHSVWEDQWKEFVTITGEVKNQGEYNLTSGMRLTDLIFKAGNFTREAYLEIGHLYRTDWRSQEKTIHTFNLSKALQSDAAHNLLLQDLDQVVVHSMSEYVDRYTVSAQGLVNRPGEYPYATNMTVKDLLIVAGNVRDAAYMEEAELVRFSIEEGRKVETNVRKINLDGVLAGDPEHNLNLRPLDVVTVKAIPEWWDKKKTVTVTGEVFFPGTYQIRKDERLSDILQRAGGFTEYAYLFGTVFARESVKAVQRERLGEMAKRLETEVARMTSDEVQTAVSPEDLAAQSQFISSQKVLLEKIKSVEPTGRVVVDLKPINELAQGTNDLVLEDGDTIYIPRKPNTINVLGAVYNPTALSFDEKSRELRTYLEMTGGPTDNAETKSMYVVQANGTVISSKKSAWWSDFESTRLNPGDTILVPERVIRPSYMRNFKDITQILYQIATTAGVTAVLF